RGLEQQLPALRPQPQHWRQQLRRGRGQGRAQRRAPLEALSLGPERDAGRLTPARPALTAAVARAERGGAAAAAAALVDVDEVVRGRAVEEAQVEPADAVLADVAAAHFRARLEGPAHLLEMDDIPRRQRRDAGHHARAAAADVLRDRALLLQDRARGSDAADDEVHEDVEPR